VNRNQMIYLCVGMIASGKSTFARKQAKEGAIIINHDDLTEMCHGEYRYEQGLRECYRRMEEDIAEAALDAGRSVIIDRCHLTAESRRRWIEFAGHYDILVNFGRGPMTKVVAVAFPVEAPEVHARRRFEADPRGRSYDEWLSVARHQHEQHLAEPLSEGEGFDEIVRMEGNPCEKPSEKS
jgi:predicted kinase